MESFQCLTPLLRFIATYYGKRALIDPTVPSYDPTYGGYMYSWAITFFKPQNPYARTINVCYI